MGRKLDHHCRALFCMNWIPLCNFVLTRKHVTRPLRRKLDCLKLSLSATLSSMVIVVVTKITKLLVGHRRSYFFGIGRWDLACTIFRIWCVIKNMEDLSVVTIVLPPVINTNYKSTLKCDVPACASC